MVWYGMCLCVSLSNVCKSVCTDGFPTLKKIRVQQENCDPRKKTKKKRRIGSFISFLASLFCLIPFTRTAP